MAPSSGSETNYERLREIFCLFSPVQLIFLGFGCHLPLPMHVDVLDPVSTIPGGHVNVTLLPVIISSSLTLIITESPVYDPGFSQLPEMHQQVYKIDRSLVLRPVRKPRRAIFYATELLQFETGRAQV